MVIYLHVIYRGNFPEQRRPKQKVRRHGRWSAKQAPMFKINGFSGDQLRRVISHSNVDAVLSELTVDPMTDELHCFVFPGETWKTNHAGFERQLIGIFCPDDGRGLDNVGVVGSLG